MKGLNKLILVTAIVAASGASAELKSIDDAAMGEVTGQSGIVIEAGFGTIAGVDAAAVNANGSIGDFYAVDWTGAGVTIEAFKWIVDVEDGWNSADNIGTNSQLDPTATRDTKLLGGFIARDIAVAGAVDVTIDATADATLIPGILGGADGSVAGGIGITFANSNINLKVGDMGVFIEGTTRGGVAGPLPGAQMSSFGGIELIGMNIDGLNLVIRGNGL